MKFNRIFILFLLIIFTISAVSASENATDIDSTQEIINATEEIDISGEETLEISSVGENISNEDVLSSAEEDIASEINVTFDGQMFRDNLTDIRVDLPENASGNFTVKIDNEVIYDCEITDKSFSVPIKIPERQYYVIANIWPPIDYRFHYVSAFYNDIELNISHDLRLMIYPKDMENMIMFPEEILQNQKNPSSFMITVPRSAVGNFSIYVDNRQIRADVRAPFIEINMSEIANLALGMHNLTVKYDGDSYYNSFNRTFSYEVTNVVIKVPKNIIIGHDDCISIDVLDDGNVKVYIDGYLVKSDKTSGGDYILSLEDYLKVNSREVTVEFTSKKYSRTKTVPLNVSYYFDVYPSQIIYGDDAYIEIYLPDTLNNKLLTVKIDGVKYPFAHQSAVVNNIVEVDVRDLLAGNHTLFISYAGDDRFEAKNSTFNFTVKYSILSEYYVRFADGSKVSLTLPKNATGNLNVYINDVLYKSVKLNSGKASIKLDNLNPGEYVLKVNYTGKDYDVELSEHTIYADPEVNIAYNPTVGENAYVTLKVPAGCKGKAVFRVDGKKYTVNIVNGVARFNLKSLAEGYYEFEVDYIGADGYSSSGFCVDVDIYAPKVKIASAKLYTNGGTVKISVKNHRGKAMKSVYVTVKINGKTYKVKSNSKGIATLKFKAKLKHKTYKIRTTFRGASASKSLKAKHVIFLKSFKVKKSARKLVLKATLKQAKTPIKYKKVTFTFDGKKYTAKTNKKGIAKITVKKSLLKHLKTGKKVTCKAAYLKDTVSKTVRVKK